MCIRDRNKVVHPLRNVYRSRKIKLLIDILRAGPEDSRYKLSFHPSSLRVHVDPKKRVGRPRIPWAATTLRELWRSLT
eukprot:4018407-Prorocentrum_lima.AAC.1